MQLSKGLIVLLLLFLFSCSSDSPVEPTDNKDDQFNKPDSPYLSDTEMMCTPDPSCPAVPEEYTKWVKENTVPIRSISYDEFLDLENLKGIFINKKIVQLGESSHGVKEFNQIKTRFIKFLHEECGFNVLAFESGMFECNYVQDNHIKYSARAMLQNSIFGVWATEEVLELFDYIKSTQSTANPLRLSGFDVQTSSLVTSEEKHLFLSTSIKKYDAITAYSIFQFYNLSDSLRSVSYDKYKEHYTNNGQELISDLKSAQSLVDDAYNNETDNEKKKEILYLLMLIKSEMDYYTGLLNRSNYTFWRDSGMARNLIYLKDEYYANEKIIVWAHNFHIRHNGQFVSPSYKTEKAMGYWVKEHFNEDVYTVGLFCYRGQVTGNDRSIINVTRAPENSLEAIMHQTHYKYSFLSIDGVEKSEGSKWLFEKTTAKYWGVTDQNMTLNDQYDGLIFIDTVNPPDYLTMYKKSYFDDYEFLLDVK